MVGACGAVLRGVAVVACMGPSADLHGCLGDREWVWESRFSCYDVVLLLSGMRGILIARMVMDVEGVS